MIKALQFTWNSGNLGTKLYTCGHCGEQMGSHQGFGSSNAEACSVRLCTVCCRPTYFEPGLQVPGAPFGDKVAHLPAEIEKIYAEIRICMSASAYTAAVLLSRKLLMHIAVSKTADASKPFAYYVEYLVTKNYAPAGSDEWVKHIKDKGNEANHEIVLMGKEDAEELIIFLGMLMKFIYEFPERMKIKTTVASTNS